MKKSNCIGCYDDEYNHGLGSAKECWCFKSAKLIWRKEVPYHQRPPWRQKAKRFPSCYHKRQYVYVDPKRIN